MDHDEFVAEFTEILVYETSRHLFTSCNIIDTYKLTLIIVASNFVGAILSSKFFIFHPQVNSGSRLLNLVFPHYCKIVFR